MAAWYCLPLGGKESMVLPLNVACPSVYVMVLLFLGSRSQTVGRYNREPKTSLLALALLRRT